MPAELQLKAKHRADGLGHSTELSNSSAYSPDPSAQRTQDVQNRRRCRESDQFLPIALAEGSVADCGTARPWPRLTPPVETRNRPGAKGGICVVVARVDCGRPLCPPPPCRRIHAGPKRSLTGSRSTYCGLVSSSGCQHIVTASLLYMCRKTIVNKDIGPRDRRRLLFDLAGLLLVGRRCAWIGPRATPTQNTLVKPPLYKGAERICCLNFLARLCL